MKTKDGVEFVPGMTLYWACQYEYDRNDFRWMLESYVNCQPHPSGRVEDRYGKLVYIDGCYGSQQQAVRRIVGNIEKEIEDTTIALHNQLSYWKDQLC